MVMSGRSITGTVSGGDGWLKFMSTKLAQFQMVVNEMQYLCG